MIVKIRSANPSLSRSWSLLLYARFAYSALIVLMDFGHFPNMISHPILIYFMQIKTLWFLWLTEDPCLAEMDQSNAITRNAITN